MPADIDADEAKWADYESGPFCPHWSSYGDCGRTCERCGRTCEEHCEDAPFPDCDDFQPHRCAYGPCPKCLCRSCGCPRSDHPKEQLCSKCASCPGFYRRAYL